MSCFYHFPHTYLISQTNFGNFWGENTFYESLTQRRFSIRFQWSVDWLFTDCSLVWRFFPLNLQPNYERGILKAELRGGQTSSSFFILQICFHSSQTTKKHLLVRSGFPNLFPVWILILTFNYYKLCSNVLLIWFLELFIEWISLTMQCPSLEGTRFGSSWNTCALTSAEGLQESQMNGSGRRDTVVSDCALFWQLI